MSQKKRGADFVCGPRDMNGEMPKECFPDRADAQRNAKAFMEMPGTMWYVLRARVVIEQVGVRSETALGALELVKDDYEERLPRDVCETEPEYYQVTDKDQRGARIIVRDAHTFEPRG